MRKPNKPATIKAEPWRLVKSMIDTLYERKVVQSPAAKPKMIMNGSQSIIFIILPMAICKNNIEIAPPARDASIMMAGRINLIGKSAKSAANRNGIIIGNLPWLGNAKKSQIKRPMHDPNRAKLMNMTALKIRQP